MAHALPVRVRYDHLLWVQNMIEALPWYGISMAIKKAAEKLACKL